MGENFVVREMPPPGEDIRELIEIAVDEGDFVVIPVVPLVEAGEPAEVCRGSVSGRGAAIAAADGRRVVTQSGNGYLASVEFLGGDVGLGDDAHLLEVAVRQVAGRVVRRDDAVLNLEGEPGAPENRVVVLGEEDAAHALGAGVDRAQFAGAVGDDLAEAGWPSVQVIRENLEVREVVADMLGNPDAARVSILEA